MAYLRITLVSLFLCVSACYLMAQGQDQRKLYGTNNLEAAQAISQALNTLDTNTQDALKAIDHALVLDPNCAKAFDIKGKVMSRLGDMDASIKAYRKCVELDTANSEAGVDAALDMGILYTKLRKYDLANAWFGVAIFKDPEDHFKLAGKCYLNLSTSLEKQNDFASAGMAALIASKLNDTAVDENMIANDFSRCPEREETVRLLQFIKDTAQPNKRAQPTVLTPVVFNGNIPHEITDIYADTQGKYFIAIASQQKCYYIIDLTDKPVIRQVAVADTVACACLTTDALYLVAGTPAHLLKVNPVNNVVLSTIELAGNQPESIAVCPLQHTAYFPSNGGISSIDLETGKISTTNLPGDYVVISPDQQYLFSYLKATNEEPDINIFSKQPERRSRYTKQTTLIKGRIVAGGVLLAELRENAASVVQHLCVSPDGYWVTAVGAGGWTSLNEPPRRGPDDLGYGVAVFSTANLRNLQGYFLADYCPLGLAFNPVTGQVAVVGEDRGVRISDIADPMVGTLTPGKFGGAIAWSGRGDYLAMSNHHANGIVLYVNTLTPEESRQASAWTKVLPTYKPSIASQPTETAPVTGMEKFTAATDPAVIKDQVMNAIKNGRTRVPLGWKSFRPYLLTKELSEIIKDADRNLDNAEARGIMLFQLREWLGGKEQSLPAQFYLAEALRRSGQLHDALPYLEVIRGDAGQTDLSCRALSGLASYYLTSNQEQQALSCLANALYLDRQNPDTQQMLVPLLQKQQLTDLITLMKPVDTVLTPGKLPALAVPASVTKQYTVAALYEQTVASVVRIQTDEGSGSGFCVGKPDIILTNSHVIGDHLTAQVHLFTYQDGKVQEKETVSADVLYRSPDEDIAVLQLRMPQTKLTPLPVVASTPKTGEHVYAIGSPGLGAQILEQSISEGIIANSNRTIAEHAFMQLTVPVNPGNSGGPVLDEHGQVVGVVTLRADLENVSFAIPVERIRTIFPKE